MRVIFLMLILLTSAACADETFLVKNGEAQGQIILSSKAGEVERFAAQELQEHLEKISGVKLPIKESDDGSSGIVIASLDNSPALAKELGIDPTSLAEEEVVLERKGDRLWLMGKTPRAALYATYTFLHDQLGCRWLWPGPGGEYLPTLATIPLPVVSERQRPSLNVRTVAINHPHYDEATDLWMARQRMNNRSVQGKYPKEMTARFHRMGFQTALGGHGLTLPNEMLKANPEFAAEVGGRRSIAKVGRRQPHLCWSNPQVQEALVGELRKRLQEDPKIDSLALMATDHTLFCECTGCREMAEDVSTRWQLLCGKVIQALKEEFPGKQFRASAYQSYRALPSEMAPLNYVAYCAYNADYLKPMLSSEEANAALKKEMLAWKALGVPVGLRGYDMIPFSDAMWTPLVSYTMQEKRWLRDNGFTGAYSEVSPYGFPKDLPEDRQRWTANRLTLYASAQAMWNADLTEEALLKDWMKTLYGAAARLMLEYYRMMEEAWLAQEQPLTYFLHPPTAFAGRFLSQERILRAQELFQEARKLAKGNIRAEQQLELEQRMFEHWREAFNRYQNKSEHYRAWSVRSEAGAEPRWEDVPRLPAFEDREGLVANEATEVQTTWNDESVRFRFFCHDGEMEKVVAKYDAKGRDENLFSDDSVEFFLQWPEGGYAHLAFNSAGAQYDALAQEGGGFDVSWNPEWEVKTRKVEGGWIADLTIPFASLGAQPVKEGSQWKAAFKRSRPSARRGARPELKNSGWPDASYHNQHALGEIRFVKEKPKPAEVVLYHGGLPEERGMGLQGELLKRGLVVTSVNDGEAGLSKALKSNPAVVVINYRKGNGREVGLSKEWFRNELRSYLEGGGIVLLASGGSLELENLLNEPELEVKWSAWTVDKRRRTSSWARGGWATERFDLAPALDRRVAPASAYRPIFPERWEVLASLKLEDQSECPYLLRTAVGKGMLYLTTSAMGYSGGGEIFGRHHPGNAAGLLENLIVSAKSPFSG